MSDTTILTDVDSKTVVLPAATGSSAEVVLSDALGPTDHYQICGKVGDGGMGVVYLARDRRLGRFVAIKRLNETALASDSLRQRFLQEARAVAALNHAHVVHIYELGEDQLGPYIVMEYVAGPHQTELYNPNESPDAPITPPPSMTLERYVNARGAMTATEAVEMILKLARTMAYAHSCGIIHRDLKPANVLLDVASEPKIVDFGLARLAKRVETEQVEAITVPGERLLSLGYSAPELEEDASISDERADVYSLGAIFYFLLIGRNPRFYREQDIPLYLREVMRRSLENTREQRFRSVGDFIRALTEAQSRGQVVVPTVKTTWRCKWCDAVNPITTKFCAECGWDGSESCPECDAQTFVGQQFCSACGADCRVYEQANNILKQLTQAMTMRRYDRIAALVGRLQGFEPSGSQGQAWLNQAREIASKAEKCLAKRGRLATSIPRELKAENYERAATFIEEFRLLNEDQHVYQHELEQIPLLILERDSMRIKQALTDHQWSQAATLIDNLSPQSANSPEVRAFQDILKKYTRQSMRLKRVSVAILIALIYLLIMPLAGLITPRKPLPALLQVLFTPAKWVYTAPAIGSGLQFYLSTIDRDHSITDYFNPAHPMMPTTPIPVTPSLPKAVLEKQRLYESQITEVDAARRSLGATLRVQYRQALSKLSQKRREAGDYEGLITVNQALEDFKMTNEIGRTNPDELPELTTIKESYQQMENGNHVQLAHQVLAAYNAYVSALDHMRKLDTKRDNLAQAKIITDEINRVKALDYIANVKKVAGIDEATTKQPSPATNLSAKEMEEVKIAHDNLLTQINDIDKHFGELKSEFKRQYVASLRELIAQYNTLEDTSNWTAASQEMNRFLQYDSIDTENIVLEPEALRAMQLFLLKEMKQAEQRHAMSVVAKTKSYITELETWKRTFTMKDLLACAAAVNTELKRIRKSPIYLNALNSINADNQSHAEEDNSTATPSLGAPSPTPQAPQQNKGSDRED